tara:strand:- start:775 stop:1590 length:816 start_codon:yes stop_codon:yes gene_type:complete
MSEKTKLSNFIIAPEKPIEQILGVGTMWVGCGSAFSTTTYKTAIFCPLYGSNPPITTRNLLVEAGPDIFKSLYDTNIPLTDITDIFVTHCHADHVGGLEELAFRFRYLYNGHKPVLHITKELANILWYNTLRGGMQYTAEGELSLSDYFEINTIEPNAPFEIANNTLVCRVVDHVPGQLAYSLQINNDILYSGDTNKPVVSDDVKQIFHEVTFVKAAGTVHTYVGELMELPESQRKKIKLIHYADGNSLQYKDLAEEYFDGFVQQHELFTY